MRTNIGFLWLAAVYVWSPGATAAGAGDDSAAQAHVSAPALSPARAATPASIPAPASKPAAIDARILQRPIIFQPDRPTATLERRGLAIVDGVWIEGWLPVGVTATAVGGVALTGGFFAWGMAGLCALSDEADSCDSLDAARLKGGIVMVVGAVTLMASITLLTSSRTSIVAIQTSDGTPPRTGIPGVQVGSVRLTPMGIEF